MKTAADTVRIGVLGPLEVTDADGRLVRVGGHRVRALLILLALEPGRVVPVHSLIGRLWPQERPADAANALQSLVSRLRVALRQAGVPDGVLESSPAGYRLAVPPDAVDAIAFESSARAGAQALARGDAAEAACLLRTALGAWRGSALTDVAAEEFAFAPAARLAELRVAATLDRIDADIALGSADAALIGELRELTAADPLAERPAALLMRALAATGRQSEALGAYQLIRGELGERLGVDPSPQLEQAYLAILRQEIPQAAGPADPATAAETVPASAGPEQERAGTREASTTIGSGVRRAPTSFVGRADDVAAVLKRLAAERLVTLTGPGGVGKTRLASEAAAGLAAPAWLAELAPVTDPAEVPYAVQDALGMRERSIARRGADPAGDPVDRLCAALADREAVLILDNCEHVIDAAAALAERLLTDCPRIRIVATSREPLQIHGETLHVVAPLPAPPAAASSVDILAYPAVRLFEDRAAAVVRGFELEAANAEAIAGICRTLDGMPLAIELAAPWLRTLTAAQLAERLADRFSLLTGGSRTVLPRHQTLRAVVDWSWNLLSDQEKALARRLAVLPGGVTLAAAERMVGNAEVTDSAGQTVLTALAGLVAKSILTRADDDAGEPRYRMLETVRAYGLERLAEAGEDTAVRDAVAAYYLDLVETADPLLRTADQSRWFRILTAEQDNVNASVRWSIARGDVASALRFVRSLGYYGVQVGHGEADSICREVLDLPLPAPMTRQLAEGRVICALLAAGWSWDIDRIRQPLREALDVLAGLGDDEIGHPLVAMAEPLLMQYDGDTSLAQRHLEGYISARDPWLRAIGQIYLSSYAQTLGTLDCAEEHCLAGLAGMRDLGDHWGVAMALTQLAEFAELRADHAVSIAALTEAAALGRELAVWGDLTFIEGRLAVIYSRSGDFARAEAEMAALRRAAQVRGSHIGNDRWVEFMRAELAWREGDYAAADECCLAVLATIADNSARWWHPLRAQVKARLAMTALRQGDSAASAALLGEALDAAAAWWEHPALAAVLDACAAHLAHRSADGDPSRAAALLGAAHAIRGAFDESSLDAPQARETLRAVLGPAAFDTAYDSVRGLGYHPAVALARASLAASA
ncbi:AfsR/SARP family transcriptional regulator [Trebonia kvetii]|uniref:AfsR/SARP family transcriptional regulator n=1 Tax=Trebonia kvetii TaxID=2480626 RepID=UPI0016528772|nr:BTAD domain-containing putative transcriptional regulator [Trebonia kvetii]